MSSSQPEPRRDDEISLWRQRILEAVIRGSVLLGLIAWIPSVLLSAQRGLWTVVLADTAAYAVALGLYFSPGLGYRLRARLFLVTMYALSAFLLVKTGLTGAGLLWLFTVSILSAVILGVSGAVKAVVLNAVTVIVVGTLVVGGVVAPAGLVSFGLSQWMVIGTSFIFLELVATVCLAVLLRGFEAAFSRERDARAALEAQAAELLRTNDELHAEMEHRHALEAKLRQAHKLEAVGTFAGGIAHDFNNMLTPIIGHTALVVEELPEDSDMRGQLNEVLATAERARELVGRILTFSRKADSQRRVLPVGGAVDEGVALLRASVPPGVELVVTDGSHGACVRADPIEMQQVLVNLGANALQAMEGEGGRLEFALRTEGEHVELLVSDTGVGMSAQTLERAFEPFFSTKPQGRGTGLGLSIAHGIVTALAGQIAIESELGKGTRVLVRLPLVRERTPPELPVPTAQRSVPKSCRVLLVDDDASVLAVHERVLRNLGHDVQLASSAEEAMELFRGNPGCVDVAVTDIKMPGMGGLWLAEELTRLREDLPVIVLTGYLEADVRGQGGAAGVRAFLCKPCEPAELGRAIADAVA